MTGPVGDRLRAQEHDRARHLIVELKAPDITLGRKELDQVEDYANVIVGHPRFATGGSSRDDTSVLPEGLFAAPDEDSSDGA